MSVLDIDGTETTRHAWEATQISQVLGTSKGNRAVLRDKLTHTRAKNWVTAFGNLKDAEGLEIVSWEEIIESKGQFKINRAQRLGSGQFSETYGATDLAHKTKLAVKILIAQDFRVNFKVKDLNRVAKLLGKISHPKIIQMLKIYETKNNKKWYIFHQLAPLGSVQALIQRENCCLAEDLTKGWARDIAEGLSYLHFLGIAHRQVNPKHVLLFSLDLPCKLSLPHTAFEACDPENNTIAKCRSIGTPDAFSAPETIFGNSFDPFPADIWGYACTVFYMLVARPPLEKWNDKLATKEQLDTKRWSNSSQGPALTPGSKVFLEAILHGSIDKRPAITEVLSLHWLF